MADVTPTNRWVYRGVFLTIAAAIAFAQLLPLNPGPGRLPGPDVLLALTVAWLIRRPDAVPVLVVAGVFLMADLLFMRAPGLWAMIIVILSEMIRSRGPAFRDMSFPVEWLMVGAYLTVATFVHVILQALFFVPQPGFGQTMIQLLFTLAVYPLVVGLGARSFGLRKPVSGEFNPLGGRA